MRAWIVTAALALSACAFSSETALFTARDAAYPIEDGALVEMREGAGDETQIVRFRRTSAGYEVSPVDPEEPPEKQLRVLFVPVPQTPEEDYVLQVQIDPESPTMAYAFAWRTPEGVRLLSRPGEFDEIPEALAFLDAHSRPMSYGERQFTSRQDPLTFQRDFVAPFYIRGGRAPEDAIDLIILDESAPRPAPRKP